MHNNVHKVVVNGQIQVMDLSSGIDLTNQKHVDKINEERKANHKKYIALSFGLKQYGLGDVVDRITTITGIKWFIKKMFKECGCEKRRIYLNRWNIFIPYIFVSKKLNNYKELKAAPFVTEVLKNNTGAQDSGPISRNLLGKGRKTCGCGKKRT
jgi:hypothetical protein